MGHRRGPAWIEPRRTRPGRRTRCVLAGALAAAASVLAGPAGAAPRATTVPLAPHGDAVDGSSGAPVALSPTAMLVSAKGADGAAGTADDVTLLVRDLHASPVIAALPTPNGSADSSRIARLAATRAVVATAGADGAFRTADDAVLVLDRLGSANTVAPVVVGGLGDNQQFTPERLAADRFVVSSLGPDLTGNTADDELVVVSDVGGLPTLTRLSSPFQRDSGRTHPVALSPTSVLQAANGPDKKTSTADDVVRLFRGIGGEPERVDVAAPGLNRRAAGRPVRLSARHALVVSAGPDLVDSTADDQVLLLDAESGTSTPIPVPFAKDGSAGRPETLGPDLAVATTQGADGVEGTADDAVAVLSGLGAANAVTFHVVGATGDDNNCRPARLGPSSCALVTFGPDLAPGTADDRITVLRDVGSDAAVVEHVDAGALSSGTASLVLPIAADALVVAGGGADRAMATADDALAVVTGIGRAPRVLHVPAGGSFDAANHFQYVPQVLGEGRVAFLSSGADGVLGAGRDDGVRVVARLPLGRRLAVSALRVRFGAGAQDEDRVTLRARLRLDDAAGLPGADVTVSVGNASQTIAAAALTRDRRGVSYDDAQGAAGFVRRLRIEAKSGRVALDARVADDALETSDARALPVAIEFGSVLVPDALAARRTAGGIRFRKR